MKIDPITLSQDDINTIVNIISRGSQCEIKREKDNLVIVEVKRYALVKKPIKLKSV